jgi:hypothetical protein
MWLKMERTGELYECSIKPNHRKTIVDIYAEVVRYSIAVLRNLLMGEGSLTIILRSESYIQKNGSGAEPEETEDEQNFPSWVPRWDLSRPT